MIYKKLWEIMVPTTNDGMLIEIKHHEAWDEKISQICNGLTLLKTVKGLWRNANGLLLENMIPVRIACTDREIEEIADITANHYCQDAVMWYLVSPRVEIKNYK